MCEEYGIGCGKDALKAVGVFGGGIGGTGRLCGAAAAAVSAIGLKYNDDAVAKNNPEQRERSAAYIKDFLALGNSGSDLCKDLRPLYFKEETRCLDLVEEAYNLLKKHLY